MVVYHLNWQKTVLIDREFNNIFVAMYLYELHMETASDTDLCFYSKFIWSAHVIYIIEKSGQWY